MYTIQILISQGIYVMLDYQVHAMAAYTDWLLSDIIPLHCIA